MYVRARSFVRSRGKTVQLISLGFLEQKKKKKFLSRRHLYKQLSQRKTIHKQQQQQSPTNLQAHFSTPTHIQQTIYEKEIQAQKNLA